MLSEVISYIDSEINGIGYMPKSKGLVEKHVIDGKNIPCEFCKGEWMPINVEDEFIYHRLIDTISVSEVDEEQTVSCEVYHEKTYPMRAVLCKKKSSLNNSIFDNSRIGEDLANIISAINVRSLGIQLKADTVQIQPEEIQASTPDAYSEEFGLSNTPLDYTFIYVNYQIIITGTVSCFRNLCQEQ